MTSNSKFHYYRLISHRVKNQLVKKIPLHSKGKRKANDQSRDTKGRYTSKKKYHIAPVIADYDTEVNEFNELNVSDGMWGK